MFVRVKRLGHGPVIITVPKDVAAELEMEDGWYVLTIVDRDRKDLLLHGFIPQPRDEGEKAAGGEVIRVKGNK